jgi:lipoprotein-releasing system permease protein
MGVRQGSEVVLMSLTTAEGSSEPVPKMMRYTVAGIFETGMYEYDLNLVYISIASAQELYGMKGIEGIQIKTTNLFKAATIVEKVREKLGGYPYRVQDWSRRTNHVSMDEAERLIIYVISFIILVAALIIISSLITMI